MSPRSYTHFDHNKKKNSGYKDEVKHSSYGYETTEICENLCRPIYIKEVFELAV